MKKAFLLVVILFVSVISTACINNLAVQELNNKAKDSLNSGDYETAISRLKSSIDLDSTIYETHYNLGIAYTQAEKYPEAVEAYKNVLRLKPSFADAYYSLAVAQENYANGIIDGSLKSKDKAKAIEKSSVVAAKKNLTIEEKTKVAQLINDSINSYSTYLEKGKSVDDKPQVQEKIQYLKNELPKYEAQK